MLPNAWKFLKVILHFFSFETRKDTFWYYIWFLSKHCVSSVMLKVGLDLIDIYFILKQTHEVGGENEMALIQQVSWSIVTRLSYEMCLLYWIDMVLHFQVKRIMVPVKLQKKYVYSFNHFSGLNILACTSLVRHKQFGPSMKLFAIAITIIINSV